MRQALWVVKHPLLVLAITITMTVIAVLLASGLKFQGDFAQILPDTYPEVRDLNLVMEKTDGATSLVVALESPPSAGDAGLAARRAMADRLAPLLVALPGIKQVNYRNDVDFFRKRALLFLEPQKIASLTEDIKEWHENTVLGGSLLDDDIDDVKATPAERLEAIIKRYSNGAPAKEYIESQDGAILFLFLKPQAHGANVAGGQEVTLAVQRAIDATLDDPLVQGTLSGPLVVRMEEEHQIKSDLKRASLVGFCLVVVLITLVTRRLRFFPIIVISLGCSLAWVMGLAYLFFGEINQITGFMVAVLAGLGIDFAIHLWARYELTFKNACLASPDDRRATSQQALVAAMAATFRPSLASAATTAAAFVTLILAEFVGFSQFGVLASAGIALTLLASYTMMPALIILLDRTVGPLKPRSTTMTLTPAKNNALTRALTPAALTAVSLVLIASVVTVIYRDKLRFETDLWAIRGSSRATETYDRLATALGVPVSPLVLYLPRKEDRPPMEEVLQGVTKRPGNGSVIEGYASLGKLIPQDQGARMREIEKLRRVMDRRSLRTYSGQGKERLDEAREMAQVTPFVFHDLPLPLQERFTDRAGEGEIIEVATNLKMRTIDDLHLWRHEMGQVMDQARGRGIEVHALSTNIIASRVFAMVMDDGPQIMILSLVTVLIILIIDRRSLTQALLLAFPLMMGMLCLLGAMELLDIRANFINVVVFPSIIGIGIDNAIHMYHRYREEGPGSLPNVLRQVGSASFLCSATTAMGFGALMVSRHQGLNSVGQVAILGIAVLFFTTVIFFPALLHLKERFWPRREP